MKGTRAASRYAQALLELAIERNQVDAVAADMKNIVAVDAESREFQLLIQSPVISSDKKIAIFNEIFKGLNELTNKFVELITKKGREGMLADIAVSFDRLVMEHKGITPLTIISANPLDAATKATILSKLQGLVSDKTEVTEKIDPSLIGGFIVRTGDKQIDASVASQLNNLKQRLTR